MKGKLPGVVIKFLGKHIPLCQLDDPKAAVRLKEWYKSTNDSSTKVLAEHEDLGVFAHPPRCFLQEVRSLDHRSKVNPLPTIFEEQMMDHARKC